MPEVQKVSVALTGEQVSAMKMAIHAGEYATTSEIVREALREWQYRREMRQEDILKLRRLWDEGKASGPAVEVDFVEAKQVARQRLAAEEKAQGNAR